jgi:hypothetical protein
MIRTNATVTGISNRVSAIEEHTNYWNSLTPTSGGGITNFGSIGGLTFTNIGSRAWAAPGFLRWDDDEHGLVVDTDTTDSSITLGEEINVRVRNTCGTNILNGQIVRLCQGAGPFVNVVVADNSTLGGSIVFGVATTDIANNGFGRVTTFGKVRGLVTTGYAEGAIVYLGKNGAITNAAPLYPAYEVAIGVVEYTHGTEGRIFVKPYRNGWIRAGDIPSQTQQVYVAQSGTAQVARVADVAGTVTGVQSQLVASALQAESDTLQTVVNRGGTVTNGIVTIDAANARTNTYGGLLGIGPNRWQVNGGTASGYGSWANGGLAIGISSWAGAGATAIGDYSWANLSGTASGLGSWAYGGMASGSYSWAMGGTAIASNDNSFAWNDQYSHGDGSFNIGAPSLLWLNGISLQTLLDGKLGTNAASARIDTLNATAIKAITSGGGGLQSFNGTPCLTWGAGGGGNVSTTDGLMVGGVIAGNGSGITNMTAAQIGAVSNTPAGIAAAGGVTNGFYPLPGCLPLGTNTSFSITGSHTYYSATMAGVSTVTVTRAASSGFTYCLSIIGTNALILANANTLNTWTLGGTNTYIFSPTCAGTWVARGMTP